MTEKLTVEVEKTSLITLLDIKICRVCNLARYDELKQRLINQQLKQEIENLERQIKKRVQKQNYRAQHNKLSLSHHIQEMSLELSDDDDVSNDDSFPNPTVGQHHEWTESGDIMLINDRFMKRQEHWKLKNLSEY